MINCPSSAALLAPGVIARAWRVAGWQVPLENTGLREPGKPRTVGAGGVLDPASWSLLSSVAQGASRDPAPHDQERR